MIEFRWLVVWRKLDYSECNTGQEYKYLQFRNKNKNKFTKWKNVQFVREQPIPGEKFIYP